MSSSKAKKKRKKQRLRLKKKKFNLKELLKKLERECVADLWKKLAASMAAFDNHSGTRRPIGEDGLGLFCNKKAMKALMKSYSQPFEPTTNDLNRLQSRAGHSVRSCLNSEAPTARKPTEQPFQTRPPPAQESQHSETSVRALVAIPGNMRRDELSDAILVNPTVPVAPPKFSWQLIDRLVQRPFRVITQVPLKILWEWCSKVPANSSFPVNFPSTEKLVQHIPKPPVHYQQPTTARPSPESQPPDAKKGRSAKPPEPPSTPDTQAPSQAKTDGQQDKLPAYSDKNRDRHEKDWAEVSVRKCIAREKWTQWLRNKHPQIRVRSNSWSAGDQLVNPVEHEKEPGRTSCLAQPVEQKKLPRRTSESSFVVLAAKAQQVDAVGIPQLKQLIQAAGTFSTSTPVTLADGFPLDAVAPSWPLSVAKYDKRVRQGWRR